MKTFAIDFAYYDFGDQIYTIKWIMAKTEENAIDALIKRYSNIHILGIREMQS
ncbi:hypothetical protein YS9_2279 [Enterococcus sp. C1]|uniref:hypothetical protein n=1 Tax=Enterococcus sp. C1 TaxID=1182762 RepID=UPI000271DC8C|nr:hypothetical protein [Enterococcus sp. C1]EJF48896.1 hypothetical protein YS9_2279 [Enterococcus sp. C1]